MFPLYNPRGTKRKGIFKRYAPYKRRKTRIKSILKSVSSKNVIETKFHDDGYSASLVAGITGSIADPATQLCINGIGAGDTEDTRDGRKYMLKSLHIKGRIQRVKADTQTAADASRICRVVVCLDTQSNEGQMNPDDYLKTPATGGEVFAFRDLSNTKRFKSLYDKRFVLDYIDSFNDGTDGASNAVNKLFEVNVPLSIPVQTSGTGGTIAAINDNSIHVFAYQDAGTDCTFSYVSRVRFQG